MCFSCCPCFSSNQVQTPPPDFRSTDPDPDEYKMDNAPPVLPKRDPHFRDGEKSHPFGASEQGTSVVDVVREEPEYSASC